MSATIVSEIEAQIGAGNLREDAVQLRAAARLDDVLTRLANVPKPSWLRRAPPPVRGLYMWGGVGRGKSMLMDMFAARAPVSVRRVHFHEFMQDVHARIHAWRQMDARQRRKSPNFVRSAKDDPIAPTAKALAEEAPLLCFDEFHVTDIADAMILSRLFSALISRGVTVVATSNRAPKDLYKNGLNRQLFLPFIEMLTEKLEIFDFAGDIDHRLRKLESGGVYFSPLDAAASDKIEAIWARLIRPAKAQNRLLTVQGRTFEIIAAGDHARTDFNALCARALGAADYLMLARSFGTLIIENVPIMGPDMRNEAKRFVTLIDALYEQRTKVILSAGGPPQSLYNGGTGAFEFQRTASRLIEMQSLAYLEAERAEIGGA